MLRILHVIRKMDCGGTETLLMNIYRNIDRSQIQFDFMVHSREPGFYDEEIRKLGGTIFYAPAFKVVNIVHYTRFWNTFFKNNKTHQIVHGHIHSCAAIYLNIAKKYNRITIAHSHNTNSKEKNIKSFMFKFFSYPIRYIADYFLACSKQAGVDRFGKRVANSNRFQVMNNGIFCDKYRFNINKREMFRHEIGVDSNALVIGHVGRFSLQKNHEFIIRVFEKVHELKPNSQLCLIGKGELENDIRKRVADMRLSNHVKFMGITDHVEDYLQAMDVFLFPSIYEGLGIAVIEAQAAGLPCIVSEAIVTEADIHAGLMKKMSLNDSPENWATAVIECSHQARIDTCDYVEKAGYDIKVISKSLADFYESII